jgi:hypothetical protein
MLLGYDISANDNDDFFITDEEKLPKEYLFKNTYEYEELPGNLRMKKRKLDIGYTYDGFAIVSEHFKILCGQNKFEGLEFIQLPMDNNFYFFKVNNIIEFDAIARRTTFEKFSNLYNKYQWIHGATPVCLKNKQPVPEGTIYRTDVFFGAGVRKSPVLLVGIETKKIMESWKLKGIYFDKILDEYPWQKEKKEAKPKSIFKRLFK